MMIQPITNTPAPSDNSMPSGTQKADGTFRTLITAMKEISGTADKQGKKAGSKSGQDDDSGTANKNGADAAQTQGVLFIPLLAGGNFLSGMTAAFNGSNATDGSTVSNGSAIAGVSNAVNSPVLPNMATAPDLSVLTQTNQNPLFAFVNGTGMQNGTQTVLPMSGIPENASASVNPAMPTGDAPSLGSANGQILLPDMQTAAAGNPETANVVLTPQLSLPVLETTPAGQAGEKPASLKLPVQQNHGNEQVQNTGIPEADIVSGSLVTGLKQPETGNGTNTDTGSQNMAFSGSKQSDSSSDKTAPASLHAIPAAQYMTGHAVVPVSDESSQVRKPVAVQVSDQITANLKKNTNVFQVDLYPESLGKVSVKLSMDNNVLTVKISADDAKTQSLLMAQSDRIQSMLQNSTNQTVQIVPQDKQWYEQSGYPSGHSQQQQQQQNSRGSSQSEDKPEAEDFLSMMQRLRVSTVAYA